MNQKILIKFLVIATCTLFAACKPFFFFESYRFSSQHLKKAEEFSRAEDYEKAIMHYKNHIADRLSAKDRPEWENPYFYYLIIGDLYLLQGKVSSSLAAYNMAEDNGVDVTLVADRYRYVASWHENKDEWEQAFYLLQQYEDRDPLLFNLIMDRLGRKITKLEDAGLER
jgi:tetratricopeptide (TPR) repeat protein